MNTPVQTAGKILSLWGEGFISKDAVIHWADNEIIKLDRTESIPDWLEKLSVNGPENIYEPNKITFHGVENFPIVEELRYSHYFILQAIQCDPESTKDIEWFIECVSPRVLGEDSDDEETCLGYAINVTSEYDNEEALKIAKEAIIKMNNKEHDKATLELISLYRRLKKIS